ncbi:hypothetical protein I79_009005 [Cricetulus griseus]|uniref:Uncharacterized protein n=1 Tax=Cricetulus griseus TaxID=10029 RepID=G3HEL8_CRIGR|nr:hypothetical protein I79_009005 [Cricetulus griseus]
MERKPGIPKTPLTWRFRFQDGDEPSTIARLYETQCSELQPQKAQFQGNTANSHEATNWWHESGGAGLRTR